MYKNKNLELKKHVGAIHFSNALSLVQRKITNALLFNAYPHLLEKEEHSISVLELCRLIGYDSNDHKAIKAALINLLSTVLEWNLIDKDSTDKAEVWNASSIIADARIKGAICTYSYSKRMRELLYRPEMYGRLNMEIQTKFKSSYGLALYENCIRYQKLSYTPWIEFFIFRKLMGVEEGKYTIFRDFKRRVLDKAMSEVNQYTPIVISPELRKSKEGIKAIRFSINIKISSLEQTEATVKLPEHQAKDDSSKNLIQLLRDDFGLSEELIEGIFNEYEFDYISEKVNLIMQSKNFRLGKIREITAYLIDALKKNYKVPKSSADFLGEQSRRQNFLDQKEKKWQEEQWQQYSHYLNKNISDYLSALEPQKYDMLLTKFKTEICDTNTVISKWYQKKGLEHSAVKAHFNDYVKKRMHKVLTFDEFKHLSE